VVYLSGHIENTASRNRIQNAILAIHGILGINNNLVLDDQLTLEIAVSLGKLENIYDCKFFTGVSHGVVSLNGEVSNEKMRLLAEQIAASNPSVRGVINNVRISSGARMRSQSQPFLQPAIGEIIYFLDGISGVVKQVIINPNNRLVIAMIIQGQFADQQYGVNSVTLGKARLPEQLVFVPMKAVRYLTKVSGFLNIKSSERDLYLDFDPGHFFVPSKDWVPPYPYCSDNVLFPFESRKKNIQIENISDRLLFGAILEDSFVRSDSSLRKALDNSGKE
jgi:uncharacterized protein YkvS